MFLHIFIDIITVYINLTLMNEIEYFESNKVVTKKQYEAIRAHYVDKLSFKEAADKFGYTLTSYYSLIRDFKKHLKDSPNEDFFFIDKTVNKKKPKQKNLIDEIIINLRKKNFSIDEIKTILDAQGKSVSESYIYKILKKDGFTRLPRRTKESKILLNRVSLEAPKSMKTSFYDEEFNSSSAGLLMFLHYIKELKIDEVIKKSKFPETKTISKLQSILCFLALKLSNVRRFSADDIWCMDKGYGLFAGLNVLPKTAWYSSYSHKVTKSQIFDFIKELHKIWIEKDLLGDTTNLDFTTIPYWGEGKHLENNWSGKRRQALSSMLAVLAQDPDSGIIDYGNTDVTHKQESDIVLEYLDFYKKNSMNKDELKYLVFDSKFTNYENLGKLDQQEIKFITIRRRGKNIIKDIENIPQGKKKKIRVQQAGNKHRTLYVYEQNIFLPGYNSKNTHREERKNVRQIAITGHGKIKPALIITNDFDISVSDVVRKYSRRWLVEKAISEQIDFFHLNRVSSSIVVKVDFDFVMSILAHNLYRIFAQNLARYEHYSDMRIFEKFINNSGVIKITETAVIVTLRKKRELALTLEVMDYFKNNNLDFLNGKKLIFEGASHT